MNRIAFPAIVALFATAACAPMPPSGAGSPPPAGADGECNAEPAGWAIGRAVDQALTNRVIQDTGSRHARVIKPGMAVTEDFRPDRVNIDVNQRGAVTGIRCG